MELIQKIEYEEIIKEEAGDKFFKELEEFAQNNPSFLSYSKVGSLKPQQYVGIIQTKSGVLEIFPKVPGFNRDEAKILLFKMLKTLKNHPFKNIHLSNLEIKKLPLLEIFIRMFLNEIKKIIQKGIKSDYVLKNENQRFLRGKLKISNHIKQNFIHKERFFVEYSEYLCDIKINRILKTALLKIKSNDFKNQKMIREFLFAFDGVKTTNNYDYLLNRNFSYYKNALFLAKLFLENRSFNIYLGDKKAFALLFDMNKLFESFVGWFFKKKFENVNLQDKRYTLFENEISLIPDIVINENIIIDTKWKIIEKKEDIVQSDLYQMYAYISRYNAKRGYLIFPKTKMKSFCFNAKFCEKEAKVKVKFFDLKKFL